MSKEVIWLHNIDDSDTLSVPKRSILYWSAYLNGASILGSRVWLMDGRCVIVKEIPSQVDALYEGGTHV